MRIKELHQILQERKNGKVTQNDIARAIGTSRANVSKLFAKNSFLNDDKLKKIEEYFDVKLDGTNDFVILDYYPDSVINVENGMVVMSKKCVPFKIPVCFFDAKKCAEYFMCHSIDNSMYPLIMNGDFLIIEKAEKIENDKIYAFVYEKDLYIRRLAKNIKEIIVKAENKDYKTQTIKNEEAVKFYLLGRVVNVIRGESAL